MVKDENISLESNISISRGNMEVNRFLRSAVPGLVEALAPEGMNLAARAIMTTDSF